MLSTKTCIGCKETKSISEFGEYKAYADGINARCKVCCRARTEKWRAENQDKVRRLGRINKQAQRDREGEELTKLKWREWYSNNQEHRQEYEREGYAEEGRRWVGAKVSQAITAGILVRPDVCSECGENCKPDAHHTDYTKPLDVTWLCVQCHADTHVALRV